MFHFRLYKYVYYHCEHVLFEFTFFRTELVRTVTILPSTVSLHPMVVALLFSVKLFIVSL